MALPLETYKPFAIFIDILPVPIDIPEDNTVWTDIINIQETSLPNGTYIITGSVIYSAESTNKDSRFRSVVKGVANTAISYEAKDASNLMYEPFRLPYIVEDGTIDFKIQGQAEAGGGEGGFTVARTEVDYERKLETTMPL